MILKIVGKGFSDSFESIQICPLTVQIKLDRQTFSNACHTKTHPFPLFKIEKPKKRCRDLQKTTIQGSAWCPLTQVSKPVFRFVVAYWWAQGFLILIYNIVLYPLVRPNGLSVV